MSNLMQLSSDRELEALAAMAGGSDWAEAAEPPATSKPRVHMAVVASR
jgi:hypothetical protein